MAFERFLFRSGGHIFGKWGKCGECILAFAPTFAHFSDFLELRHTGEFRLDLREASAEPRFVAVEVGERFGVHEAFVGDGGECALIAFECIEEFGERAVGLALDPHTQQFDFDEAGFLIGDAAETPRGIGIFADSGEIERVLRCVTCEDSGAELFEFGWIFTGEKWGFGGEPVGSGVEG